MTTRVAIAAGALLSIIALSGCADGAGGSPQPTQAQQLCRSWGYDTNDPACLRTFRRDPP
jgi:hypothetical protein